MKRPTQHVTENISFQIFSQVIPSEWIIRDIVPDYGLDKSVEIVEKGIVTGKELLVQVKGTANIKFVNDRVSYSLKVTNLKYYLQKDIPVILIVVDINQKKCYWLFLQQYVYDALDNNRPIETNKVTTTVSIPIENDVSLTISELKEIAFAGPTYILSKKLDNIPTDHLELWKSNTDAISKLLRVSDKLQKKMFQARLEIAYRYQKENDYGKSREILFQIAEQAEPKDPATYIKTILAIIYQMNPFSQNKEILKLLDSIKELVEKSNNTAFQIMWWGDFLETVFVKMIDNYNKYRTLHLVALQGPRGLMAPFLGVEINQTINGLYQIEKDFIQWIEKAYQNKEFYVYLDLLRRLATLQFLWCYNNSFKGNPTATKSQIKSIEFTLLSAEKLAMVVSQDLTFEIYLDLATLYNSIEANELRDKYLRNAMELATKLDHKGFQHGVQSTQESFKKAYTIPFLLEMKDEPTTNHKITDEQEEEMLKHLLKVGGIDITSDDELAQLARIGLKDRNPERILKFCKNLHTEIINYGPIWDMVALPSTGTKILYCEKKEVAIFGTQLDLLLESMKQRNCANCKEQCSRPNSWKWTHEWHKKRKKPQKMILIMQNYFKR
jgi:hypothetical protein